MVDVPVEVIQNLIWIIMSLGLGWVVSLVALVVMGGRDLGNNIKLFIFNRFRGGNWGKLRFVGSDMKEKTIITRLDRIVEYDKGLYAGTPDVTVFNGTVPVRQHIKGLFNAIDLLQRQTRRLVTKVTGEIDCPHCKESITIDETREVIETVDVPTPQPSDSSELLKHTLKIAQTTNPTGSLSPEIFKWLAILGVGVMAFVALAVGLANPEFIKAMASASAMR